MDAPGSKALKKAATLLKQGKPASALPLLLEVLRGDPNHPQAWFLMSYAVEDPQRRIYALMQALKADPGFERARARIEKLGGFAPPAPKVEIQPTKPAPAIPIYELELETKPEPPTSKTFSDADFDNFGFDDMDTMRAAAVEDQPSTAVAIADEPAKRRRGIPRRLLLGVAAIALVAFLGYFAVQSGFSLNLNLAAAPQSTQPRATAIASLTMVPTWTATPVIEVTATPGSSDMIAVPQFAPVSAQIQAQLDQIAAEVAAIRDIEPLTQPESVLVPPDQVALTLAANYLDEQKAQQLSAEERVLQAFGLLAEGDFLTDYELSSHADPFGGFYRATESRIHLVGNAFEGALPYAFARLTSQTALMQTTLLPAVQPEAECPMFSDACRAQRALLLGDVTLAGEQWLAENGDSSVSQAIQAIPANTGLVQIQDPPAFVTADLFFPTNEGRDFVSVLFEANGWANVNLAYEAPPASTEQILHPEKFSPAEPPLAVQDSSFAAVLGSEWSPVGSGNLGEWLTYLVLSRGADFQARLSADAAATAAAGWGGDAFQASLRASDNAIALAQHWVMDSATDATQLVSAIEDYLAGRFGEEASALGSGECWLNAGVRTCLFATETELLWLIGPDEIVVLQVMLAQYPAFQ